MANLLEKHPENIVGKYYIDEECIDCELCNDIAPDLFFESPEKGYHYVGKQPESESEIGLVIEAIESCPTEAIGDDGLD